MLVGCLGSFECLNNLSSESFFYCLDLKLNFFGIPWFLVLFPTLWLRGGLALMGLDSLAILNSLLGNDLGKAIFFGVLRSIISEFKTEDLSCPVFRPGWSPASVWRVFFDWATYFSRVAIFSKAIPLLLTSIGTFIFTGLLSSMSMVLSEWMELFLTALTLKFSKFTSFSLEAVPGATLRLDNICGWAFPNLNDGMELSTFITGTSIFFSLCSFEPVSGWGRSLELLSTTNGVIFFFISSTGALGGRSFCLSLAFFFCKAFHLLLR